MQKEQISLKKKSIVIINWNVADPNSKASQFVNHFEWLCRDSNVTRIKNFARKRVVSDNLRCEFNLGKKIARHVIEISSLCVYSGRCLPCNQRPLKGL